MTIGFIGLGIMGKPMAKNILKAGFDLYVYNRSDGAKKEITEEGGHWADSVAEVCKNCRIIITMLPDSPDVEKIALGPGGISENASKGTLLIDMSSIEPDTTKLIGKKLKQESIKMMDAPVSGGESGAQDGTLTVMAGGNEEDFMEALPILKSMASSATLTGPLGSGNVCKLANQIIVAANIAALSEALNFAINAGSDPEKVITAIRGGLAGSKVMETKAEKMLSGNSQPGFKIDLHVKDMNNVKKAAEASNTKIPISEMVTSMMKSLQSDGKGQKDHSILFEFYRKNN